jgi:hypothetical protein
MTHITHTTGCHEENSKCVPNQ